MNRSGSSSSGGGGGHLSLLALATLALVAVAQGRDKCKPARAEHYESSHPHNVSSKTFGFMASVGCSDSLDVHCGGVIIDQRHILTSSQCVGEPHSTHVLVGGQLDGGKNGSAVKIEQVQIYKNEQGKHFAKSPGWDDDEDDEAEGVHLDVNVISIVSNTGNHAVQNPVPTTVNAAAATRPHEPTYNLALLRTKKPIVFNCNANAIELPKDPKATHAEGTSLFVAGWGSGAAGVARFEPFVDRVEVVSCEDEFSSLAPNPREICTDHVAEGQCKGASGGPLYKRTLSGYELVAIAIRLGACDEPHEPNHYVRVAPLLRWIEKARKSVANGAPKSLEL